MMKDTLNLPDTSRLNPDRPGRMEPEILDYWSENRSGEESAGSHTGAKNFYLLDGPPYSSSGLNPGQAINKILKDAALRYKRMTGYNAPLKPGWDTHGLPNEVRSIRTFKLNREKKETPAYRSHCRESAESFMALQESQYRRLGITADWGHRYATFDPDYESMVIGAFRKLVEDGYIYRGDKPVHWCAVCEMALADSEVEYRHQTVSSMYISFPLEDRNNRISDNRKIVHIPVWTTTPWTLTGNVALALHPDEIYCLVESGDFRTVVAEALVDTVMDICRSSDYEILNSFEGRKLESLEVQHPILNRTIPLICHENIRMDHGTGFLQVSPGIGMEDYEMALKFGFPVTVPINGRGHLTGPDNPFQGLHYTEASDKIIDILQSSGKVLCSGLLEHSYPHCWRCGHDLIFRTTSQWFMAVDMNNLRQNCIEQIEKVRWIPANSENRITRAIADRPDWCISRQRTWGIPIPAFQCSNCGKYILDPGIIERVENLVRIEGGGIWFEKPAGHFLPDGFRCPECQSEKIEKIQEIFDVWFESGLAFHYAELSGNHSPDVADLCIEGTDQHRGWFQSSILLSMALNGCMPFKSVFTHGWILDGKGRSMHPSMGNMLELDNIIEDYGADHFRFTACHLDCTRDMRLDRKLFKQTAVLLKKLRNTLKYLTGNLYDFDPETDAIKPDSLKGLDRWAIHRFNILMSECMEHYENYSFHRVIESVLKYISRELNPLYLEARKDILYCHAPDSLSRRSAQTVIHRILTGILSIMAPIIPFTCQFYLSRAEALSHTGRLVTEISLKKPEEHLMDEGQESRWEMIMEIREQILHVIEDYMEGGMIPGGRACRTDIYTTGNIYSLLHTNKDDLRSILRIPVLEIHQMEPPEKHDVILSETYPGTGFSVKPFRGEKCPRCRNLYPALEEGGYCGMCESAIQSLKMS